MLISILTERNFVGPIVDAEKSKYLCMQIEYLAIIMTALESDFLVSYLESHNSTWIAVRSWRLNYSGQKLSVIFRKNRLSKSTFKIDFSNFAPYFSILLPTNTCHWLAETCVVSRSRQVTLENKISGLHLFPLWRYEMGKFVLLLQNVASPEVYKTWRTRLIELNFCICRNLWLVGLVKILDELISHFWDKKCWKWMRVKW